MKYDYEVIDEYEEESYDYPPPRFGFGFRGAGFSARIGKCYYAAELFDHNILSIIP